MPAPPPNLAIPDQRRALATMFIELALAFHAGSVRPGETPPGEMDANQVLVGVAAMLGHAAGRPMNASEIAARLHMPRTSVLRRLEALIDTGLITRIEGRYYLEDGRASGSPYHDTFELILSRGFAVLGPYLSKLDT